MTEDGAPPSQADLGQESQPEFNTGCDSYRSLVDPNIRIFVAKDVVPSSWEARVVANLQPNAVRQ
jgi:hypothetical protein